MENQKGFKISQYACAVLLIVSSIVMVAYQVIDLLSKVKIRGTYRHGRSLFIIN